MGFRFSRKSSPVRDDGGSATYDSRDCTTGDPADTGSGGSCSDHGASHSHADVPGGKALPPGSSFAADDGSADPAFAAIVRQFSEGDAPLSAVIEALRDTRVLIPMLAELVSEDQTATGLRVDKEAATGVVAIATPDGRKALPAFTSVATMAAWHRQARPVPAVGARAALAAVAEDWSLLVVDPAGPHRVIIPRTAVWAMAQSEPWRPAVRSGRVDESVATAIRTAILAQAESVTGVRFSTIPGDDETLVVEVVLQPGLDRSRYETTLAYVNRALASIAEVAERVDAIKIQVRPN
ncbi:SseB family protein [Rarobacter faecitabidus]|uniref:Type III secretion system (T3SS) SseB-like protein n=1 Tax=Rarobacter faecitabidus TaxID=13243 RepID=A0A542ZWC2_RARFA|nr:SseB family protein [Rarobacter faecitabidus]TQL64599.1 type III secretion system (T3SS) SseB-like protein [Rarobacter faecitabidus]